MAQAEHEWRDRGGVAISQCTQCKHWQKNGRCAAFPDGVPMPILKNIHDHRTQYANEKLLFTPRG